MLDTDGSISDHSETEITNQETERWAGWLGVYTFIRLYQGNSAKNGTRSLSVPESQNCPISIPTDL